MELYYWIVISAQAWLSACVISADKIIIIKIFTIFLHSIHTSTYFCNDKFNFIVNLESKIKT